MKRKKGTLRLNAARAKARLVAGYWNKTCEMSDSENKTITTNEIKGTAQAQQINKVNNTEKKETTRISGGIRGTYDMYYGNVDSKEEILYRRIAAQMGTGNCDNLLGSVLDKTHMATLNEVERERYVFNMSALVQKSIERYNKVC